MAEVSIPRAPFPSQGTLRRFSTSHLDARPRVRTLSNTSESSPHSPNSLSFANGSDDAQPETGRPLLHHRAATTDLSTSGNNDSTNRMRQKFAFLAETHAHARRIGVGNGGGAGAGLGAGSGSELNLADLQAAFRNDLLHNMPLKSATYASLPSSPVTTTPLPTSPSGPIPYHPSSPPPLSQHQSYGPAAPSKLRQSDSDLLTSSETVPLAAEQPLRPVEMTIPFSLWDYLQEELLATDFDSHQEMKWERVSNFLSVPLAVEKVLGFGFILCLDSFLHTFTILPIRFFVAIFRFLRNAVLANGRPLPASHKADILRTLLLLLSIFILVPLTDASKIYHSIRGQDTIKLYVIFNALEIGDRLCISIGQDILDCLFSRATLEPLSRRRRLSVDVLQPLLYFMLSTLYVVAHSLVLVYQLTALNVAINSYDQSLLTLLVSNQFVEIKGSVFKKFEKDNLFQITCADIVERFQLAIMLTGVAVRNLIEVSGSDFVMEDVMPSSFKWLGFRGSGLLWKLISPAVTVLLCEVLVDWLKHAFITKFNHIRPSVYERYMDVLCRDLASGSAVVAKGHGRGSSMAGSVPGSVAPSVGASPAGVEPLPAGNSRLATMPFTASTSSNLLPPHTPTKFGASSAPQQPIPFPQSPIPQMPTQNAPLAQSQQQPTSSSAPPPLTDPAPTPYRKHPYVDQSPLVARRLGFASVPLAVLAVLIGGQCISLVVASGHAGDGMEIADLMRNVKFVGLGLLSWICLVVIKIILGVNLVSYATLRKESMESREAGDVINDFGRDPIGEGKDEQIYNKELKTLLERKSDDATRSNDIGEGATGKRKKLRLEDLTRFTMVKRIW